VRARAFREDLFFRLDVLSIRLPPLRERREDLPQLIDHFLLRAQERNKDSTRRRLTQDAMRVIEAHPWPGNVRELENVIQRLLVSTTRSEIDGDAVRGSLIPLAPGGPADTLAAAHLSLNDVEERYVDAVLRQAGGNKNSAAAILGIDVSTLYRRARQRRR
jgi:two-component system response regulator HydG